MIYAAAHKNVALPDVPGIQGIQVGGASEDFPGFVRDNSGVNISEKNPNYCELTALYWMWKNTDDPLIGLAHYRRFFGKRRMRSRVSDIYSDAELAELLGSGFDILLAAPVHYHVDAKAQLLRSSALPETFEALREEIVKRDIEAVEDRSDGADGGYLAAFDSFFAQNAASLYNMFYCRREIFDAYCTWLFPILFDLELKLDLDAMNGYQKRVYGFLAERLLNIWVMRNGLRVKPLPVISTEYTRKDQLLYARRDLTNRVRFFFSRASRS